MTTEASTSGKSTFTLAELPTDHLFLDQEVGPIRSDLFEDQASMLQSIEKHGLLEPLIVSQTTTDKYSVLDGHRRLQAVKKLGYTLVPCLIHQNLSLGDQLTLRFTLNN